MSNYHNYSNNNQDGYYQQQHQQQGGYYQQQQQQLGGGGNNGGGGGYYQQQPPYYPQQPAPNAYYPPPQQPPPQQQHQNHYSSPNNTLYNSSSSAPITSAAHEKQSTNTIVKERKYKDMWATILFALTLTAFAVCSYFGVSEAMAEMKKINDSTSSSSLSTTSLTATNIGILVLIPAIGGFILSLFYFVLMKRFAGKLIKVMAVMYILFLFAGVAYLFVIRQIVGGVVMLLFALLYTWFLWSCRHRIPFAKFMLKTVTAVISQYPATIFSGILGLLLQTAFAALFFFTVFGWSIRIMNENTVKNPTTGTTTTNYGNAGGLYAVYFFLLFTFYWTTQVVKNVVHVTVSGLFATYYFMGISSASGAVSVPVSNPTAASAKRALTTSFGSICYGSLIIAIIQTLKAMARSAQQSAADNGNIATAICACCAVCILSCIEDIAQYFNHYAFTQVAIYGKDYCSAAKSTWALIKTRGIDAIINDNLIGTVLTMGGLFIGLICAGVTVGYLFSIIPASSANAGVAIVVALLALFIGMGEFAILAEVIESGTATTFVCLAENPEALRRTKPDLFNKVQAVYPQVNLF